MVGVVKGEENVNNKKEMEDVVVVEIEIVGNPH